MQSFRVCGVQGGPAMLGDELVTKQAFTQFASLVVRSIAMRNANLSAEKIAATV